MNDAANSAGYAVRIKTWYNHAGTMETRQLKGDLRQLFRKLGIVLLVLSSIGISIVVLIARGNIVEKIFASIIILVVGISCITLVWLFTYYSKVVIRDNELQFSTFGFVTRVIPLDSDTYFQIHLIGKMKILQIVYKGKIYVPNGVFNRDQLIDFLKQNNIPEQPDN